MDEDRGSAHIPQIVGGAKFGGIIQVAELLEYMDDFYRTCECAGVDSGFQVISWEENPTTLTLHVSCTDNIGNPANCDPDDPCSELGTTCAVIPVMGNILDVDFDNNGINESFSLGLRLGFAGTTLDRFPELFADGFESSGTHAWSGGT